MPRQVKQVKSTGLLDNAPSDRDRDFGVQCKKKTAPAKGTEVPEIGQARWQWFGTQRWHDYAPEVAAKIEHFYLQSADKKSRYFKFWDGGIVREVDLALMIQLPGRRKLRRIGPEIWRELGVLGMKSQVAPWKLGSGTKDLTITGTELKKALQEDEVEAKRKADVLLQNKEEPPAWAPKGAKPKQKSHSVPCRRSGAKVSSASAKPAIAKNTQSKHSSKPASSSHDASSALENGVVAHAVQSLSQNDKASCSLQRLSHPSFAQMDAPSFDFVPTRSAFQPKGVKPRKVFPNEDLITDMVLLAEEYAQCLKEDKPRLPVRGTADEAFGAVALALYMAGPYDDGSTFSNGFNNDASSPEPFEALSETSSQNSGSTRSSIWNAFSSLVSSPPKRPSSAPAGRSLSQGSLAHGRGQSSMQPFLLERSTTSSSSLPKIPRKLVFNVGIESRATKLLARQLRDAWLEWQERSAAATGLTRMVPLSRVPFNFDWVLASNHLPRRMDRLHCSVATIWHAAKMRGAADFMSQTQFVRNTDKQAVARSRPHSAVQASRMKTQKVYAPPVNFSKRTMQTALQVAVEACRQHRRSAAVFICSPVKVGDQLFSGLVTSDEGLGEEEEACMRSTFYLSMLEAKRQSTLTRCGIVDATGAQVHIPEDGAVLCKNVLVMRDTHDTGFAPYEHPVEVSAVFAITVPDEQVEQAAAELLVRKKVDAIIKTIGELKIDHLVISDDGAGHSRKMFAREVGRAMAYAVQFNRPGLPKEVVLTGRHGDDGFYSTVSGMGTVYESDV